MPPEQVHIQTFPFTDEVIIELIPDAKTKHVIEMAEQGDRNAERVVNSMDPTVIDALRRGDNLPCSFQYGVLRRGLIDYLRDRLRSIINRRIAGRECVC